MREPTGVRLTESMRVEAFSDGVMAIIITIITILVLELRVPHHEPGRLLPALVSMWGSVLALGELRFQSVLAISRRLAVRPARPRSVRK
jgi:hypothetical protein